MTQLLVLGSTGVLGSAVVGEALAAGQSVIAVARSSRELTALHASHERTPRLQSLVGSVASDAEAAQLVGDLQARGLSPGAVIASLCGQADAGRLVDQPAAFLGDCLDADLMPHLHAARHLLPVLADAARRRAVPASYVVVGGPGAERPWAGHGHRSIAAAALRMLARVLHEEARVHPVRVQLFAIDSPARTAANAAHACSGWPAAESIARQLLALLEQPAQPVEAVVHYRTDTDTAYPDARALLRDVAAQSNRARET